MWWSKYFTADQLSPEHFISAIIIHNLHTPAVFFAGPHFIEYLSYEVTPECCVVLKCKVRCCFWTNNHFPCRCFSKHKYFESVDVSYIPLPCCRSGGKHEEGDLGAMVQGRARDQSGRAPGLHWGSAETGNCSGEEMRKDIISEVWPDVGITYIYVYFCIV